MGLFTFGKKKKPSKSVAPVTKSALPISTTAKIANETNVLEVAVANDPVLPLTTKADTQNISLMEDILGELSVQSNGENKWKPLGKIILSWICKKLYENDRMFSFGALVIEIWSRERLEYHCLVACYFVILQVLVTNQVVH